MPPSAAADGQREQRLADLLVRVTEQLQQGVEPDLAVLAGDDASLAEELRQLLSVAQFADGVARLSASSKTTRPKGRGQDATLSTPLPRRFADYELHEEIGRGGMGIVYKAWDLRLKRYVALKMILRGEHASADDLARFRAEALAVAGLAHRNIVPVYDVGEHDGRAFFSMQYVAGASLAQWIAKGPLPSRRAARYLAAISRAVHHAHESGILHRDLKPSNVIIDTATDEPMVTDFGLAKRLSSLTSAAGLTQTGAIVGTPSYVAPEQASGQGQPTPAADVYSLGATLYEMLTGRPPFQAASVVDVLLQVRSEEPVRPGLLNRTIDPDLELICLKCLEKRPEHRYATARALAEDLERYLNSEPVRARSSSLVYFLGRIFRETHHAPVMENWGGLWMWHAVTILLLCAVTNALFIAGVRAHLPYLLLWSVGLVAWGLFFWHWRRRAGPVVFVERQMAHAWAGGVIASIGTFIVEMMLAQRLELQVLTLTPILAVAAGIVFLVMAGTLSGWFYVAAALCFLAVFPMWLLPDFAPLLLGAASFIGFFVPGLRYYRRKYADATGEDVKKPVK